MPQERSENLPVFSEGFGKVQKRVITADEVAKLLSELLWNLRTSGQNESGWHNELASVCENHPSSIENWQKGLAKVSLLDALRLMAHLGEPFAKPLLALAGLHVGLESSAAEQRVFPKMSSSGKNRNWQPPWWNRRACAASARAG